MCNKGLQFGVLGPLQLRAGSAFVPLGAPKQRAVLTVHKPGRAPPKHTSEHF
ncbi:hypothetical protein [Mycobacterium sp.]|uniref:hypothetical protein n=1 Tax=Mycobacterium sp. TaxID=1785 RepID=UPI0031E3AF8C